MTEALCSGLNLRKSCNYIDVCGIGSSPLKIAFKTQTTIRSRINNFETSLEFLISPQISGYHPSETVVSADLMIPRNIKLAELEFHRARGVDMLLGAEAFFSLLSVGQIRLGDNLPTLQKTLFGWIVSGKCSAPREAISSPSHCVAISTLDNINRNVEKLWQLEEVNSKRQHLTSEEYQCETHFLKTVTKSNGRIMVKLPFKGDVRSLGNSRDIAMRRFLAMENKLERNPTLKSEYTKFLKEYEELGHMSLIKNMELDSPHYFLPHYCVLKPGSTTTKLRVVFDASCRTASQVSLNELLMDGPQLQNELLITLLRFRCHRYGLTADITKMYRQFLLHPDDRKYHLILWRYDKTQPISRYSLNTVTYGTAAAPYLAIRSLQFSAETCPYGNDVGKKIIKTDFYVDDMLTGADDLQSLLTIKKEVCEVLNSAQLLLTK